MLFQNGRTVNQLFDALSAGKVWAGLVVVTSNRDRQNTKGTTKRGRWVFFFCVGEGVCGSLRKYMVIVIVSFFCCSKVEILEFIVVNVW